MNRVLWRKTWRDLWSSRGQTLALIFLVAMGITSYVAFIGAYRDLDTSYQATYERLNFADVTFALQAAPESAAEEVAQLAGVQAVTGRVVVDSGYELPDGDPIRARLIGLPADRRPAVNDVLVEKGRYFEAGEQDVALVESHFADYYGKVPGDPLTPFINGQKQTLEMVGAAASPEYLVVSPSRQQLLSAASNFAVLFVPLEQLQAAYGMEGQINQVAVLLDGEADRPAVIGAIEAQLSAYGLESTTLREDQPSNAALQLDLEGYAEMAYAMPALILFIAAASVYVMLGRVVNAQKPNIGLMKALGYANRAILLHYLAFALLIGLVGTVIGIGLGALLGRGVTTVYAQELGIPLVRTRFYPDLVLSGSLLSLIFSAAAGLGPARSATQRQPAEAMNFDPALANAAGKQLFFERWLSLPLWVRLPVRTVFRARRRTLSNLLGIVFAFILVLTSWSWLDSMAYLLDLTFTEVNRWDVEAVFNSPQPGDLVQQVAEWEGVEAVEPAISLPATVAAGEEEAELVVTAFASDQSMHGLQLEQDLGAAAALAPGNIILTPPIAEQLGLALGDAVTLETAFGEKSLTYSAASDELAAEVAYVGRETITQMVPAGMDNGLFNVLHLQVTDERADEVKKALYGLPNAASVMLRTEARAVWEQFMTLFYAFFAILVLFSLGLAFALLYNAMTVSVSERQRELATMRAIGARRRLIGRLLVEENVILWLLALAPGMAAGWWIAVQLGELFSSELFNFQIVIEPRTYVFTALGILATMILAAVPAFRRINRLNLAEATKVLS